MKKFWFQLLLLCFTGASFAQSDADALRFSQTNLTGTARSVAMGGAFGALGADFASLSINPAGLGMYNKSEFTLSPAFNNQAVSSMYLGSKNNEEKFNFNFGNLGLVLSSHPRNNDKNGWQSVNFAIGYNKINNFNSRSYFSGYNTSSSMIDQTLQKINSGKGTAAEDLDPFNSNLAYQTYLINPIDTIDTTHYYSEIPSGNVQQSRSLSSSGALNEVVMAFAANYKSKLYIGASIGFMFLNYKENSTYQESDNRNQISGFNSFTYNQSLSTTGSGYNFKLGMIYRPVEWMRLGGSVQTPTMFDMKDNYTSGMKSSFDNQANFSYDSPKGFFNYELTTPMRTTSSMAIIIKKQAAISVDYERLDYSVSRFHSGFDIYQDVNNTIDKDYRPTGNWHFGGEWKWDNFCFRGGFALYGRPFRTGRNYPGADAIRTVYSAGIGYREGNYFMDMAYSYGSSSEYYKPYSLVNQATEGSLNKIKTQNLLFTLGYRF